MLNLDPIFKCSAETKPRIAGQFRFHNVCLYFYLKQYRVKLLLQSIKTHLRVEISNSMKWIGLGFDSVEMGIYSKFMKKYSSSSDWMSEAWKQYKMGF